MQSGLPNTLALWVLMRLLQGQQYYYHCQDEHNDQGSYSTRPRSHHLEVTETDLVIQSPHTVCDAMPLAKRPRKTLALKLWFFYSFSISVHMCSLCTVPSYKGHFCCDTICPQEGDLEVAP